MKCTYHATMADLFKAVGTCEIADIQITEGGTKMKDWHQYYYHLARVISERSKDPRKQVGAIVTEDNYVRGTGYNGFPRGIEDTPERLNNKELKNKLIIHAEVNALISAQGKGDTIYIFPCLPCSSCLGQIIQAQITKVVTGPLNQESKWDQDLVLGLIDEVGINLLLLEDV